jgi:excisionase family DNA binding protein
MSRAKAEHTPDAPAARELLTKGEAAAKLNVSTRTIESYAKSGKLRFTYQQSKHGQVALYSREDVERLKHDLNTPASLIQRPPNTTAETPPEALISRGFVPSGVVLARMPSQLPAVAAARPFAPVSLHDLSAKLMLNLLEASALAGLSRDHLREAISAGKLKARILGRGWKVKRSDLESYIAKL